MSVFYSVLTGAIGGILIGLITEYYTGGETEDSPVGKIAKSGNKELAFELEEKGYDWI